MKEKVNPENGKIAKEQMDSYSKELSDFSLKIMKMPIAVIKQFADYLTYMVNFSSWVADLDREGMTYKIVPKSEVESNSEDVSHGDESA